MEEKKEKKHKNCGEGEEKNKQSLPRNLIKSQLIYICSDNSRKV